MFFIICYNKNNKKYIKISISKLVLNKSVKYEMAIDDHN